MKYYIIKKRSSPVRKVIIDGLHAMDRDAEIVDTLEECDVAILQQGWARSKVAVAEKLRASDELKKPCKEGYLYTDKYAVQAN